MQQPRRALPGGSLASDFGASPPERAGRGELATARSRRLARNKASAPDSDDLAGRPLGNSGNVSHPGKKSGWGRALGRHELRDDARRAWKTLGSSRENPDEFRSLRLCGVAAIPGVGAIEVRRDTSGEENRAAIVGTTSCGSPWACPVCAARVRERRRMELHGLVERGSAKGWRWVFVTGTLKHRQGQSVAQQRKAIECAWRAITTGKKAQERRKSGAAAGTVRAIEFMLDGPNGSHGHIHALVAVKPWVAVKTGERELWVRNSDVLAERAVADAMETMGASWKGWAEKHMDGLRPDDAHGWKWEMARSAKDATDYVTKTLKQEDERAQTDGDGWTVSHELARGDAKRGRDSLSAMELLELAVADLHETGDCARMLRMVEYARATRGMRAIVVSRSLTDALGKMDERTDEEIAQEPEAMGDEWETVAVLPLDVWAALVRSVGVAGVLEVAARDGTVGMSKLLEELRAPPVAA